MRYEDQGEKHKKAGGQTFISYSSCRDDDDDEVSFSEREQVYQD